MHIVCVYMHTYLFEPIYVHMCMYMGKGIYTVVTTLEREFASKRLQLEKKKRNTEGIHRNCSTE